MQESERPNQPNVLASLVVSLGMMAVALLVASAGQLSTFMTGLFQ